MSNDYTVRLQRVFQGPMDLLLHLVREQEVEIHEISIARLLTDYMEHLNRLEKLDIELAGEFLVMAAHLMAIKSRSLLPTEEIDLEEELDPRDELIQRLVEYRRFKSAADRLDEGRLERAQQAARGFRGEAKGQVEREFELGEVTVWDLLATFSRLMRETLADKPHRVSTDPRPLRFYVDQLVHRLRDSQNLSLRSLVASHGQEVPTREALVGCFCALLELVKLEAVEVLQDTPADDIQIRLTAAHAEDLEELVRTSHLDEELPDSIAPTGESSQEQLPGHDSGKIRAQEASCSPPKENAPGTQP